MMKVGDVLRHKHEQLKAGQLSFEQCCRLVLEHCPDEYAKTYAHAGLDPRLMLDNEYRRVQCLYVLSNMDRWRGDVAKRVRVNLQRLSKPEAWR